MRALLAITTTLALFAAGCGDDDEDTATTPAPPAAGGVASPGAAAVDIKGFKFDPADTSVKVGQTVTWTNSDSAGHDVVADDGAFESDTLDQGDTFEYTADKAGTFSYICSIHPQMKATLIVE